MILHVCEFYPFNIIISVITCLITVHDSEQGKKVKYDLTFPIAYNLFEEIRHTHLLKDETIKTAMRYRTLIRMPKSGTLTPLSAGKDVEQEEFSFVAGGIEKWHSHFRRQRGSFLQN